MNPLYLQCSESPLPTMQEILNEQTKEKPPLIKEIYKKGNIILYHNYIWVPSHHEIFLRTFVGRYRASLCWGRSLFRGFRTKDIIVGLNLALNI